MPVMRSWRASRLPPIVAAHGPQASPLPGIAASSRARRAGSLAQWVRIGGVPRVRCAAVRPSWGSKRPLPMRGEGRRLQARSIIETRLGDGACAGASRLPVRRVPSSRGTPREALWPALFAVRLGCSRPSSSALLSRRCAPATGSPSRRGRAPQGRRFFHRRACGRRVPRDLAAERRGHVTSARPSLRVGCRVSAPSARGGDHEISAGAHASRPHAVLCRPRYDLSAPLPLPAFVRTRAHAGRCCDPRPKSAANAPGPAGTTTGVEHPGRERLVRQAGRARAAAGPGVQHSGASPKPNRATALGAISRDGTTKLIRQPRF
jgi:hypothetical protein